MLGDYAVAELALCDTLQVIGTEDDVVFNGNSLSDCTNLFASKGNYDDINQVSLETYNSPNVDGGGVLSYFINGKSIEFTLVMRYDTEVDLMNAMDEIKKRLAVPEGELEIYHNGERRIVYVALTSLQFNRDFKQNNILGNVQINFRAMNHFLSKEPSYKTFLVNGDYNIDINYTGTAVAFYKTYMIFGAGNSGITEVRIEKDGYVFSVPVIVNDGDVLLIDGVEKNVYHNGILIDYSGVFKQLNIGSNPISIKFNTGAIVNTTTTIIYNKLWL